MHVMCKGVQIQRCEQENLWESQSTHCTACGIILGIDAWRNGNPDAEKPDSSQQTAYECVSLCLNET